MNSKQLSVVSKQLSVISKQFTARCLLLTAYCLLLTLPTHAHGGGTIQLSAAPAGPYYVTVWTTPDPARADTPLHVTVAVVLQPTNQSTNRPTDQPQPVLDAAVQVQLYLANAADPLIAREATTAQSTNKLFYEVDFSPPNTGRHRIEIAVSGPQGEGTVDFALEIEPPANNTWLLIGLAVLALIFAAAFFKSRPAPVKRPVGSGS